MPLLLGKSGTQFIAMVTKLLSSYCGAYFVESSTNALQNKAMTFSVTQKLTIWEARWPHD